jgi:hypothetical protein
VSDCLRNGAQRPVEQVEGLFDRNVAGSWQKSPVQSKEMNI